jgi:alpha-L-rhamnosidase
MKMTRLKQSFSIATLAISLIFLISNILPAGTTMHPDNLKCEYLPNPLGIDVLQPRFFWTLNSLENGNQQTAYKILVASSEENLAENNGNMWDSGQIKSNESIHIEYAGKKFSPSSYYFWKVKVWDQKGVESSWSRPAFFSIGLLKKTDWKADWIGAKPEEPWNGEGDPPIPVSPLLRKSFSIEEDIERAVVHVTALGLYELRLNGEKVGDHILAPEWTDYLKRLQVQTYDVTDMLVDGENAIGALLGDGWYAGRMGPIRWDENYPRRGGYGLDRRLLCQLEIAFRDGKKQTVVSNKSWRIYEDGPVRMADNFLGETQDTRKAVLGWDRPGFDDKKWQKVYTGADFKGELVAQMNEPIRVVEEITPIAVTEPQPGVYIFDLGQNIAGWCRIRLDGPAGQKVVLRHGEMLNLNGSIYMENLKSAIQTETYILDGKGEQTFEPHFTYHGFRYIEVTGLESTPTIDILTGVAFASDAPTTGEFVCSNPMLNKLYSNIVWGQRGNLHSVPTDCPQRDERMGWMGDALVFAQTSIFNSNMAAFWSKFTEDIRDAQTKDGRYPDFAPQPFEPERHFSDAPGWADAGMVVPWRIYQNYGDKRILAEHYNSAKKFVENIRQNNPNFLWENPKGNRYSDWLNGNTIHANGYPESGAQIPFVLFSSTYYAYSTTILAKMATILGKTEDAKFYSDLVDNIHKAILEKFIKENAVIEGETQAGYAMALYFDLLPEEIRPHAAEHLFDALQKYDGRISTGFHSTLPMMKELTKWGMLDLAYGLLESRRFPSWGYSIDQGATTIWERWDAYVAGRGFQHAGMNSFNHYSYGAVGEWMFRTILGINFDETNPAYKHFFIKPQPGGSLTWAKGSYESIRGTIAVDWKIKNKKLELNVETPANTTVTILIPCDAPEELAKSVAAKYKLNRATVKTNAFEVEVNGGIYNFVADYDAEIRAVKERKIVNAPVITPGDTLLTDNEPILVKIICTTAGATIHYTLDQSKPTQASPRYQQPFKVNGPVKITAAAFDKKGDRSYPVRTFIDVIDPQTNGLTFSYYEGEWKELPDISSLTPKKSGKAINLDINSIKERDNYFVIQWKSFIEIQKDGEYTFYTESDDGSQMFINDKMVVNNDGVHGSEEKKGTLFLKKGRHPITILYLQDVGGASLRFTYSGPGISRQVAPASMFFNKSGN